MWVAGHNGSMGTARLGKSRVWLGVAALIVAGAILLSSCGGSGYLYVGSSDGRAYFKVPLNWKSYSRQDLLLASNLNDAPGSAAEYKWLIGYDSDPHPSVAHVSDVPESATALPSYPVVYAYARDISDFSTRDKMSFREIRNLLYPVDGLLDGGFADIVASQDIVLRGGFYGQRIVFDYAPSGIYNAISPNHVI